MQGKLNVSSDNAINREVAADLKINWTILEKTSTMKLIIITVLQSMVDIHRRERRMEVKVGPNDHGPTVVFFHPGWSKVKVHLPNICIWSTRGLSLIHI